MSDNIGRSKIVLPTPETCGWRTARPDGTADCGLLGSLMGNRLDCHVSHDQCRACCDTFPPSPNRMNPVIASILYTNLCKLEQSGDQSGGSSELIQQLMPIAKRALRDEDLGADTTLPLRSLHPCCHRGACRDSEGSPASPDVYACDHPSHETTTIAHCKRCQDWSFEPRRFGHLTLREIVPATPATDAIRHWSVGVTTSARSRPTLEACLEGLQRAGWNDIHLFLDGSVHVPSAYAGLPTTWREQRVGACPSWFLSLAEMVALHPEADAYAMFQDDAYPHYGDSLREYLEEILWPSHRTALVSLYNPGLHPHAGWHRLPADWDWGTLAVVFPPALARMFLSDPIVARRALPRRSGEHQPIPEVLREWTHRRAVEVWCPYPSLIQHVGSTSTIWTWVGLGHNRTSPWFSAELEQPILPGESLSDFPEAAFPCPPDDQARYAATVARGRDRMRKASVAICGIARDVAPLLPRTIARIEKLGAMFHDYRVFLVENDSVDRTLPILRHWEAENHRVRITTDKLGRRKFPQTRSLDRAKALAEYRNRYLDQLRDETDSLTHAIVLDMDLVGGWSYDGIANSFGHDDWDFVGSYGLDHHPSPPQHPPRRRHYDNWAFRADSTSAATALIDLRGDSLKRGMPLLDVESCFGGLGLYRMECLRDCRYGGSDCEHVVLHRHMHDSGYTRRFLNPSQIVLRSALVR